jgi:hypothetical protein
MFQVRHHAILLSLEGRERILIFFFQLGLRAGTDARRCADLFPHLFLKSQFVLGNLGMKTSKMMMMVITGFPIVVPSSHSGSCSEQRFGHNARFVSDSKTINVIHVCSL